MTKYKIIVEEVATAIVEVEAEDEFMAEDIGMDMWGNGDLEPFFIRDVSVTVEH